MCQLFTGAFFFAMRSYEYLQVSGTCRTKILKLKNIRFFNEKKELHHKDNYLKLADTVSITFEFQKKDTCNDTITHFRSGHKSICPVLTWCSIVQRIRALGARLYNESEHMTIQMTNQPSILSWTKIINYTKSQADKCQLKSD